MMRESIPNRGAFRVVVSYGTRDKPQEWSSNFDQLTTAISYAQQAMGKQNTRRVMIYACIAEFERS
jgi:hypothetical protein